MRSTVPALIVGLLFGAGLVLSDMVNPARVLAFLDVAGNWDPTLTFVMGGALVPSALAFAATRRMRQPVLGEKFSIPVQRDLDLKLVVGAVLFGIGWGLVGLCPGPAIAGLALGRWELWIFGGAMLAGMFLQTLTAAGLQSRPKPLSSGIRP